jgi:hypothetical protein
MSHEQALRDDVLLAPKHMMVLGSPADQIVFTHRTGQEETVVIYLLKGKRTVGHMQPRMLFSNSAAEQLQPVALPEEAQTRLLASYDRQEQRTHKQARRRALGVCTLPLCCSSSEGRSMATLLG